MFSARMIISSFAVLALGAALSPRSVDATGTVNAAHPVADNHLNIMSPAAVNALKIMCEKMGPKCPPGIVQETSDGQDAVRALDSAGARVGVILSPAYFFGAPEMANAGLNVEKETRAVNAYVVAQAKAHCSRLVAFISVDPLTPGALKEIDYWGRAGGATGLNLHLANSNFDFRSPGEVHKLAAVFRAAARWHFPIIVHLANRNPDYGATDVGIFLRDVLPFARGVPVQIAHAAGGGSVTPGTLSALGAFANAIKRHPQATANIFFDLAMVPDIITVHSQLAAKPAAVAALRALIYQIGLKRFVPGSDWTKPLDLGRYYRLERAALKLPGDDWQTLAGNSAPYLASLLNGHAGCTSPR
jgi:predicted TIM-barrel fold metal-dependent hydrolase